MVSYGRGFSGATQGGHCEGSQGMRAGCLFLLMAPFVGVGFKETQRKPLMWALASDKRDCGPAGQQPCLVSGSRETAKH